MLNSKSIRMGLTATLLLSGAAVFAQTTQGVIDLQSDIDVMLEHNADMDAAEEASANIEVKPELFPIDEGIPDGRRHGTIEAGNEVTIVVDGYPVVLQDVPLDQWFAPYVRDVAERGLISGYRNASGAPLGLYGPADPVTVEQLAKLAVEASKVDLDSCTGTMLNESAKKRWSEQYVLCAEKKNWAVFSDGSIDVLKPASRAQVVVTILQAFGRKIEQRKGGVFTDVDSSTEFGAAIETAAADNLVSGYTYANGQKTGTFGPQDSVNRAEAAKMFSLAFQLY